MKIVEREAIKQLTNVEEESFGGILKMFLKETFLNICMFHNSPSPILIFL